MHGTTRNSVIDWKRNFDEIANYKARSGLTDKVFCGFVCTGVKSRERWSKVIASKPRIFDCVHLKLTRLYDQNNINKTNNNISLTMKIVIASLLTLFMWLEWHPTTATSHLTRPFVIDDFVLNSGVMAFYTKTDGNVYMSQQAADDQPWSDWVSLGPNGAIGQGIKILSSPVGVHTSKNLTRIFAMASNGQVYSALQNPAQKSKPLVGHKLKEGILINAKVIASPTFGKWIPVGNSSLPFDAKITLSGLDSVQAGNWKNNILVFARSMTSGPNLYWCKGDDAGNFDSWARIGGSKPHLATDATVIYNRFSGYYEAFAIANDTDGKLQHAWQENGNAWHGWTSMGKRI